MTTGDTEIVTALRAALADKVGQQRFDLWFGAGSRLSWDGRTLTIGAPTPFFLDWIRTSFRGEIEAACRAVLGSCPTLEFVVDAAPGEQQPDSTSPASQMNGHRKPAAPPGPALSVVSADEPSPAADRAPHANGTTRRKFATLQSFVAGETNRLALATAEMVARRPGQFTPLLLYGPTSVGKTHLLEGIWTAARQAFPRMTTVYLSAEQFTSYFLEALRGAGLPSFRRKYRGVDLLMIDDLQFFVGKRSTQTELLHTVDTLLREGRQLVFAADRGPKELSDLAPELLTRLQSGMLCPIEQPDHLTRRGIVAEMARRMMIDAPAEVQEYVATHLTSHAREISGALCRLQATSEALRKPITLAMAQEALADIIRQSGRVIRLGDIEKAVCDVLGLAPASLQSHEKGQRVSHPRMLAMWLARKHTRAALCEIGQFFGRRTHSTVISAQRRIDEWRKSGGTLRLADRPWKVDDAIRQVERRLAAG